MPKLRIEHSSPGDQRWLGSLHGIDSARTVTIDPADFTARVVDKIIPSGTAVAVKGGKTVPYVSGGSGGEEKLTGFILTDQPADAGKIAVPVVDRVRVTVALLPDSGFTIPAAGNDLTACTYIPREG
ncbi:hypothetical protein [Actinomyces howellii]|uniref:Uncharacterized protein n=1 Tax=Actinomyces howellii TaxID=52771 RepID=A0A3S4V4K7_9ACTO|nr:hypothetical protein [Actinomyces howellii]VEG28039.1 Uncharacterised protein [Actinomyces howellii]